MANTPQFNVKTGSDSQLFFSREVTEETDKGKILDNYIGETSAYEYPQLTRRTGSSIKGKTESIESSELRKGRTKSAPRKGSSSSEGSLDIELSPDTYDDIFEAALRGEWESWNGDGNGDGTGSTIAYDLDVNPDKISCESSANLDTESAGHSGQFVSNGKSEDGGYKAVFMLMDKEAASDNAVDKNNRKNCLLVVDKASNYTIDQLKIGNKDIKYSGLTQFGGIEGEDLYQEFQHLAVNTMDLSVSPGQIVKGSFGFMGANNPKLLQVNPNVGKEYTSTEISDANHPFKTYGTDGKISTDDKADVFKKNILYTQSYNSTKQVYTYSVAKIEDWTADVIYYYNNDGIVKELAGPNKDGSEGRFKNNKAPSAVEKWISNLSSKIATTTDQFTAREGFLFVNGRRVQYGSNLTMNLNNGLKQLFAIFESDSISTAPMSLDITGTLDAYLITNKSEFLYNYGINDDDVELVFCFQDKEENPDYIYVIQIFKAKFDTDISQGNEELTISLPFTSFGERAMRIFRIKRKNVNITSTKSTISIYLDKAKTNEKPAKSDISIVAYDADTGSEYSIKAYDSYTMSGKTLSVDYSTAFTNSAPKNVIISVRYKDMYAVKGYKDLGK